MELIECSETSAYCNFNQTPGKYPKEYIHLDSKRGENLKSRIILPSLCLSFKVSYNSGQDVCENCVHSKMWRGNYYFPRLLF